MLFPLCNGAWSRPPNYSFPVVRRRYVHRPNIYLYSIFSSRSRSTQRVYRFPVYGFDYERHLYASKPFRFLYTRTVFYSELKMFFSKTLLSKNHRESRVVAIFRRANYRFVRYRSRYTCRLNDVRSPLAQHPVHRHVFNVPLHAYGVV